MKKLLCFCFLLIFINLYSNDIDLLSVNPYFEKEIIEERYNIKSNNIKDIDFYNFKYKIRDNIYDLKHGKFGKHEKPFGFDNLYLENLYYYSNKNDGYVIIHLKHYYGDGSSCVDSYIRLYKIIDGYLYCIDSIFYYNTIIINYKENIEIKVKSTPYLKGDSNCCPSGIEEDIFKIEDNNFKLVTFKVIKKND